MTVNHTSKYPAGTPISHMTSDLYPASYYRGGGASNYTNYSDDPGWETTMSVLLTHLVPGSTLLEVGCATGWFVRQARGYGMDARGVDISAWAIENPAPGVQDYIAQASVLHLPHGGWDTIVSWEMLEHVPEDEVDAALLSMLAASKDGSVWVHRIALDDANHDHHADDDETHFTIKPRQWWLDTFEELGLRRLPEIEGDLDAAFADRDWAGRFFAYEV